jgi:hypothetical protein
MEVFAEAVVVPLVAVVVEMDFDRVGAVKVVVADSENHQ